MTRPPVQQDRSLAQTADRGHVVGDVENRSAGAGHFSHLGEALLLKAEVANREDLVDHQDLRLQVGGDGEGQSQPHAAGVPLHRRVDELAHVGEVDDVVELPVDLLRLIPRMAPLRYTFSRPVKSG